MIHSDTKEAIHYLTRFNSNGQGPIEYPELRMGLTRKSMGIVTFCNFAGTLFSVGD
jgi:hypothetical protein